MRWLSYAGCNASPVQCMVFVPEGAATQALAFVPMIDAMAFGMPVDGVQQLIRQGVDLSQQHIGTFDLVCVQVEAVARGSRQRHDGRTVFLRCRIAVCEGCKG